jgi:PEP-CTERM motif
MSLKRIVVGLAVILMLGSSAFATTVTHTLVPSGEYSGTTGALITTSASQVNADIAAGVKNVYRFDIDSLLTGVAGSGQTYGGELFDLTLGAGLTRAPQVSGTGSKANYVGNNPALPANQVDGNGAAVSGAYFGGNADSGVSTTDLLAITTFLNTAAVGGLFDGTTGNPTPDPRSTLGQGTPFKVGNVYVNWDGTPGATLSIGNATYINYNYTVDPSSGLSSGQLETNPTTVANGSFTFPAVPEPASLILFGLGGLGLVAAARRRS